jgi:hypothetical protein
VIVDFHGRNLIKAGGFVTEEEQHCIAGMLGLSAPEQAQRLEIWPISFGKHRLDQDFLTENLHWTHF